MREGRRNLTQTARALRKNMTDAERLLWLHLRDRNVENLKFRRQVPVGGYVVDFLCHEKMLIVEVDGSQHASQQLYDAKREKCLLEHGFRVIRFWNNDVLTNIEGVVARILECCK
ncbi:endonuclease domain-containing protein [bacterium]|nr:endonuclease domain-containing protein [bacterium]